MVSKASGACFSQLKGRSHVGYSESMELEAMVPSRQNLSLLIRVLRGYCGGTRIKGS